jgi:hypothetical protein
METKYKFPPNLWTESPSEVRRTTKGAESFHSHFNAQFYFCHPSIYAYLNVIMQIQTVNNIKIRHISETSVQSRTEREDVHRESLAASDIITSAKMSSILSLETK